MVSDAAILDELFAESLLVLISASRSGLFTRNKESRTKQCRVCYRGPWYRYASYRKKSRNQNNDMGFFLLHLCSFRSTLWDDSGICGAFEGNKEP